jgi:hypothetical protein
MQHTKQPSGVSNTSARCRYHGQRNPGVWVCGLSLILELSLKLTLTLSHRLLPHAGNDLLLTLLVPPGLFIVLHLVECNVVLFDPFGRVEQVAYRVAGYT